MASDGVQKPRVARKKTLPQGVRVYTPKDHIRIAQDTSKQSRSHFVEQESGEYAIRRRKQRHRRDPVAPEIEPQQEDFVGLTEMIEGQEGGASHENDAGDGTGDQEMDAAAAAPPSGAPDAAISTVETTEKLFKHQLSRQTTYPTSFEIKQVQTRIGWVFLDRLVDSDPSWYCPLSQKTVSMENADEILTLVESQLDLIPQRPTIQTCLRLLFSHPISDANRLQKFAETVLASDLGDFGHLLLALATSKNSEITCGESLISSDGLYLAVRDGHRPLLVEAALLRNDPIVVQPLSAGLGALERVWRTLFVAKALDRDERVTQLKLLRQLPRDFEFSPLERYRGILLVRTQKLWLTPETIIFWVKNTPYRNMYIPELSNLDQLAQGSMFFSVIHIVSHCFKTFGFGDAATVASETMPSSCLRFPREEPLTRKRLCLLAQMFIYLIVQLRDAKEVLRPTLEQLQDTVQMDVPHNKILRIEFTAARLTLQVVKGRSDAEGLVKVERWLNRVATTCAEEYDKLLSLGRRNRRQAHSLEEYHRILKVFVDALEPSASDYSAVHSLLKLANWDKMDGSLNQSLADLVERTTDRSDTLVAAFAEFCHRHAPKYHRVFAAVVAKKPNWRQYHMPQNDALWLSSLLDAGAQVPGHEVTLLAVKSLLLKKTSESLWAHVPELKSAASLADKPNDDILQRIMLGLTSPELAGQLLDFVRVNIDFLQEPESRRMAQEVVSYVAGNERVNAQCREALLWFHIPGNFDLKSDSSQLALYASMLARSCHLSEIKHFLLGSMSMSLVVDGGQAFFSLVRGIGKAATHPIHARGITALFVSLVYSRQPASQLCLPLLLRIVVAIGHQQLWRELWGHACIHVRRMKLDSLSALDNAYLAAFLQLTKLVPAAKPAEMLLDLLVGNTTAGPLARPSDPAVESALAQFQLVQGQWSRVKGGVQDGRPLPVSLSFVVENNLGHPFQAVVDCFVNTVEFEHVTGRVSELLESLRVSHVWVSRYIEQQFIQVSRVTTFDDVFI